MKKLFLLIPVIFASACGRLSTIPMAPETTPEQWLATHPYIEFSSFILAKPTSSFIVFLLGFLTIYFGLRIFKDRGPSRARYWWGLGLLLWGIGTIFAGTSYQAFLYEIKCAGNDICAWTSWFEVIYMIFEVASINAILIGVAWSTLDEKGIAKLRMYATLNMLAYLAVSITGAFIPNWFMVSFELMMLFVIPGILTAFILNIRGYRQHKDTLNRRLIFVWLFLFVVMVFYYGFLLSGIPEWLWEQGIWFSANDVLHIGLIKWMVLIYAAVRPHLKDAGA